MPSVTPAGIAQVFAKRTGAHTMVTMNGLAHAGMHLLTVLFFIGLAGSSVVVVISFIEDLAELFGQ